jgi:hypothetical protein
MTNLSIGRLDLSDEVAWLNLTGNASLQGLIGSEYDFQPSEEETTKETIKIRLRGSIAQLRLWLDHLENFQRLVPEVFLRIWKDNQEGYAYARLRKLSLQTQSGHLASLEKGSLEIKLNIERDTLFFGEEFPLPLSNGSGSRIINGITLFNHDDEGLGHDNWFRIDEQAPGLKNPILLRLQIENNFSGSALADFYFGSLPYAVGEVQPTLSFEAENGGLGTVIGNDRASGGKYAQLRWSGKDWQTLGSWTLGPMLVSQINSGTVLPIVRFFNPVASSALQLRFVVKQQGLLVFEGAPAQVRPGEGFEVLDPLRLPLGELPLRNYALQHQLLLQAKQSDSGEHVVEWDDFLLLPQSGFLGFHALSGLTRGQKLIVDEMSGKSWSLQDSLEFKSHNKIGSGIRLQAKTPQIFYCFQSDAEGAAMIERTVSVRAWGRKQWRLP